jgi:heme A synthase
LILAVAAALLSTLCAASSLTAYLWYDQATTPNRGSPAVVVLQYVNAYLGSRDSARAALFACGDNPELPAVKAARDDLKNRERQYGVSIDVAVDGVQETSRSDNHAQVAASIVLTTIVNGSSQRVIEQWIFQTEDHGGWRVCDGHEVT